MGFFSNLKRKAYPVTVEGQKYFVRSLLRSEVELIDAAEPKDRGFLTLLHGQCNADAEPVLTESERAEFDALVPIATQQGLYDEVLKATNPKLAGKNG